MNLTKKNALLALVALTTALATGCSAEPAGDDDLAEELGTTRQELSAAFTLRARHSGKCLGWVSVSGRGAHVPPYALQQTCDGSSSQRWRTEGALVKSAVDPAYCLDVVGASTASGAAVQVYPCHGEANQQFEWRSATVNASLEPTSHYLVARHSGKCLDVEGASLESGARVNQYSCHGGENQRWVRTWQ